MTAEPSGPANDFALVPDEVTDAGSFVQQIAESLINGLRSLDTDIVTLLDNWRGTSAESFSAGWTETKQGADTILDALAGMAELLGVTSKTLDDQDQLLATETSALSVSLDMSGT
ncbi:WXG100 family type VII secretion target [Nocardia rhizosphaerihabitans]|uniref:WXG100 family type VII secretion target n=1 Tax=Nocardia rhizosphaerihabitans TaxID=1691570 RepID=UPI003672D645